MEPHEFDRNRDDKAAHEQYRAWAEEEWTRTFGAREPRSADFRDGFVSGFVDFVVAGDNGILPAIPPRRFWGMGIRNAEGDRKLSEWRNGFRAGVARARDGQYRERAVVPPPGEIKNRRQADLESPGIADMSELLPQTNDAASTKSEKPKTMKTPPAEPPTAPASRSARTNSPEKPRPVTRRSDMGRPAGPKEQAGNRRDLPRSVEESLEDRLPQDPTVPQSMSQPSPVSPASTAEGGFQRDPQAIQLRFVTEEEESPDTSDDAAHKPKPRLAKASRIRSWGDEAYDVQVLKSHFTSPPLDERDFSSLPIPVTAERQEAAPSVPSADAPRPLRLAVGGATSPTTPDPQARVAGDRQRPTSTDGSPSTRPGGRGDETSQPAFRGPSVADRLRSMGTPASDQEESPDGAAGKKRTGTRSPWASRFRSPATNDQDTQKRSATSRGSAESPSSPFSQRFRALESPELGGSPNRSFPGSSSGPRP